MSAKFGPDPGWLRDQVGEEVAVDDRIREILQRYTVSDVVHQSILRAAPEIVATVRRVEQQLQLV